MHGTQHSFILVLRRKIIVQYFPSLHLHIYKTPFLKSTLSHSNSSCKSNCTKKMAKIHIILILALSSIIFIHNAQSILFHGNEKPAKFRVYLQGVLVGPDATVLEVARASITSTSATSYGLVEVMDNPMTLGPEASSEEVGRAQGLVTYTDLEESSVSLNMNLVFTGGEYKGSTLCIVGRKSLVRSDQELPVVGGTGVFRWAGGFSISSTYSHDAATGNSVLLYDVYVVYVEQGLMNE